MPLEKRRLLSIAYPLIIWKSDLFDKLKLNFFQAALVSILLDGFTSWTLTKSIEKKQDGNYTRTQRVYMELILEATPHETVRPLGSLF